MFPKNEWPDYWSNAQQAREDVLGTEENQMAAQRNTNQTTSDDEGWEEVPTESQIHFPEDGDEFRGVFVGWSTTTGKNIPQAHFTNDEMGAGFINCGASLKQQLRNVKPGTQCKIRRTGTQDTGQDTPMVLFKVWTRK